MLLSRHREHVVHLASWSYGDTAPTVAPATGRRTAVDRTPGSAPDETPNLPQGHSRVPTVTLSRKVGRLCAGFGSASCKRASRRAERDTHDTSGRASAGRRADRLEA